MKKIKLGDYSMFYSVFYKQLELDEYDAYRPLIETVIELYTKEFMYFFSHESPAAR